MCGILGLFFGSSKYIIHSTLNFLLHRGPDDSGCCQVSGGFLGHTRLSILDLTNAGHQPMRDLSGRYTIVYNGEVYNFKLLHNELVALGETFSSHTDTEVVLSGYRVWGTQVFARLRGMFALAIHDGETGDVVLARDSLGIKPLLYHHDGRRFAFASELKPLLKSGLLPCAIDEAALVSLLRFGSVAQPNTLIAGVQQLPPGHMLRWKSDGSAFLEPFITRSASDFQIIDFPYEDAVSQLRSRLEDATRAHLISDVEVGCFLSGGIDSTSVLALMQKQVRQPIHAFSLGFDAQGEVLDESRIAERSARAIGSRFTRSVVTDSLVESCFGDFLSAIDQPSIDGFNTYLISKEAAKHVKVVLSGLGGDELFAGYPHFAAIQRLTCESNRVLDPLLQAIHSLRPNRFTKDAVLRGRSPISALRQMRTIYSDFELREMMRNKVYSPDISFDISSLSPLQSVSYAEITGYLCNTLLRDSDVVSMWHGLEVRPVLLDGPLVDFAVQLPDEYKVRDGRLKAVFVDAVKDLLPLEVLSLPKRGFEIPFAHWMNGVLRDRLMGYWESESAKEIFSDKYRKSLMRRTSGRRLKRRDWLPAVLIGWREEVMACEVDQHW